MGRIKNDGAEAPADPVSARANIPTGLGAFDGRIVWRDADGRVARWPALFGEASALTIVRRLASRGEGLVASVLTSSPLFSRTTLTGLGTPMGPSPPRPAARRARSGPCSSTFGTGPAELRARFSALVPDNLTLGELAGSAGLVPFGFDASPVVAGPAQRRSGRPA